MLQRNGAVRKGSLALALLFAFAAVSPVVADDELLKLKNHTDIKLVFDDSLSSKTAKVGDEVFISM